VTAMPSGPDAVILTEAGPGRGLGHLGRCLALAEALEECGAHPQLFVRGIDRVPEALAAGGAAEPAEWLDELPLTLAGCGIAVVDSYEAPAQLYARVAEAARVGVWLDDTRRLDYPPGLVVDGGVCAAAKDVERVRPGRVLLFGPRFQPLRRPFWALDPRPVRDDVGRILVVMGGTDVRGLGPRLAVALAAAYPSVGLDLVGGDCSAAEMAEAMAAADLSVTTVGQTIFELAAAGLPAVGIIAAENQRSNAEGLSHAGFLHLAGDWDDRDLERRVVKAVVESWPRAVRERSASAGRALCDGRGALRVAARTLGAWRASSLAVRPAGIADEVPLLAVSNDPQVRAASFGSEPIAADEHHAWFEERLRDSDSLVFVLEDASGIAGLVRFAVEGTSATVGIALVPRVRGRGLAVPLLERGLAGLVAKRPDVTRAVALVRAENDTSREMFAAAGFTEEGTVERAEVPSVRFVRAL
jgi:UDP-2,4-diacetamido-2,4,6-trideoxy-beta-L-altropyranose hydrolase